MAQKIGKAASLLRILLLQRSKRFLRNPQCFYRAWGDFSSLIFKHHNFINDDLSFTIMFDTAAQQQLKSYVYGLFDPRSLHNIPFYIGKGTGNRVFSHAQGVAKEIQFIESEEGALSAKAVLIGEIGVGNVRHVIFRQGLSEDDAFTVEASLIDLVNCYAP
jgi:hypothetical protein